MAGAKVIIRYPRVDFAKTRQEIHEVMTKFTFDTLAKWIGGTTDPIPVWSGASRASFLRLAALASTSITINPNGRIGPHHGLVAGVTEAASEVILEPNKQYGWEWSSTLAHIDIVEDKVRFIDAGFKAIKAERVVLPQPITKKGKR